MKKDVDISDLLKKAKESLQVADDLYKSQHYDFSASRSYYAMFYSTQAALLIKNLSFSKHKAVVSAFGKEFIKTGLFPKELHRYLRDAFKFRQLGDYGAPGSVSGSKAYELIKQAEEFVASIAEYSKNQSYEL